MEPNRIDAVAREHMHRAPGRAESSVADFDAERAALIAADALRSTLLRLAQFGPTTGGAPDEGGWKPLRTELQAFVMGMVPSAPSAVGAIDKLRALRDFPDWIAPIGACAFDPTPRLYTAIDRELRAATFVLLEALADDAPDEEARVRRTQVARDVLNQFFRIVRDPT
jgi:hypothetical protein